ncbi:O-antigen ligase family protein [Silicimonas sp. MF1-12-2]|uniref:O-antigen ligase family protein n=1 Tax=Silicimonas sp. MF1-12-2 TaxID=3384793 RepID=UPI0039B4DABF
MAVMKLARSNSVMTGAMSGGNRYPAWLSWAVMAIVMASPLPLASNRPVFWLLWASVIFFLLAMHMIGKATRGEGLDAPLSSMKVFSAGCAAFILYGVLQTLRLPGLELPGGRISIAPDATLLGVLRWTSYAVFFFLCVQVTKRRRRARRLAWAAFIFTGAYCALSLLVFRYLGEVAYLGPQNGYADFVTGSFINRNSFANYAGMGFCLGLALVLREMAQAGQDRSRIAWFFSPDGMKVGIMWIVLAMMAAAIISSASRMGVASTAAGAMVISILVLKKYGSKWSVRLWFVLVGLFIVLLAGTLLVGQNLIERMLFISQEGQNRAALYLQVIELIQERPVFGFGLDTFEIAFQSVHRPPVSPDYFWDKAHSTYLALWSEMGPVFGSIPPLLVLVLTVRILLADLRQESDILFSIVAFGVIVQNTLHSAVDFSLEIPANVYLFLFLLALAYGRKPSGNGRNETR